GRTIEQAAEGGESAKGVSRPALEPRQCLLFSGEVVQERREPLVGIFLFQIPVATGLKQFSLYSEDLSPFATFNDLQMVLSGCGVGLGQSVFSAIMVEIELLFAGLQQAVQFEDGRGKSRLQFVDLAVDLPV